MAAQFVCVDDAAVVRVAAFGSDLKLPPWPDLSGSTNQHVAQWRRWLQQVWAQDAFAAAIEVASPVLAGRVREVCAGHVQQPRRVRRVVVSVVRYLLRATSRATPFGLFAGVAPARFGAELAVRCGEDHHTVTRMDAEWLAGVTARLEGCPELRHRLPVVANNLAFVRGGRLVVGCQQPAGSGRTGPAEVSVRHTRAVQAVMQAAQSPITVGELTAKLAAELPGRPLAKIEGMLAELVARRILVTSLHPPMTATDPLAHVVAELTVAGADAVPQAAPLVQNLCEVQAELSRHSRCFSPSAGRDLRTCARRMAAVSSAERPLAVGLRVDCDVVLPRAVAREAEAAAAALARLTPYPHGPPAWRDYHTRFLERYGIGAVVPVSELVDADVGLGFPAGYRDTRLELPVSPLSERDARLLALAQQTAMDRSTEVVLDDQAVSDLMAEEFATHVQPHTELSFQAHAPTRAALDRGEFSLAVAGVSRAAGTLTGRFLDLLDPADRDPMVGAYARLPTVNDDALPVQVSCPPLSPRTENVARSPAVLPHLLSLAEHRAPSGGLVPLEDLGVTGDAQRLSLLSLSRGRPVEPTVFSAVELTHAAHPLLRFLCEITTARAAACTPFSWGAASRLPFLPRVRYGRAILSPACWTLTAADLPGRDAPWAEWVKGLADWRRRARVPGAVYLGDDDRRLRLNLDEPAHLQLLRADLDRTGHATLREAPDADAFGWLDGRVHEIVVPLAVTRQPARQPSPRRSAPVRAVGREHGHLPGAGEWLYVKLYGHPHRHTTILTTHLPDLLSAWGSAPEWWFLPYRDPEPHLRLRIRLPSPDAFSETAHHVGAWAAGLRRLGLIGHVQFDTYYPETGRFGSGTAMTVAESVFAADSAAAIAQLTHTGRGGPPHQHPLTAASLVDLAVSFIGDAADGMRWLIDHVPKTSTPAPDRQVHDQTIHLANPRDRWAAIRATPGGEHITSAWARRRTALTAYRDTLTRPGEITVDAVLPALLHLHTTRMTGIAPDTERACHTSPAPLP